MSRIINQMNNNSDNKRQHELLTKAGWELVEPSLDFEYLINSDLNFVLKKFGNYLFKISDTLFKNPLSILGEEIEEINYDFFQYICPKLNPLPPKNYRHLVVDFPSHDYDDKFDKALGELGYRIIILIIKKILKTPKIVYQNVNNRLYKYKNPKTFNFQNLEITNTCIVLWEEAYLNIKPSCSFSQYSKDITYTWTLYHSNLQQAITECSAGVGLELNSSSYNLGKIYPRFKLNSFPNYIKEYTKDIVKDIVKNNKINRFNILITGQPGYGKTEWANSFAGEIATKFGYFIIVLDFNSLKDLVIPPYLNKVCFIINDADNLCLDRSTNFGGFTEQMLSWLDGTRSNFIKPFLASKQNKSITILTANTVERWDEAALRKGRIHVHKIFDQVKLSEYDS